MLHLVFLGGRFDDSDGNDGGLFCLAFALKEGETVAAVISDIEKATLPRCECEQGEIV